MLKSEQHIKNESTMSLFLSSFQFGCLYLWYYFSMRDIFHFTEEVFPLLISIYLLQNFKGLYILSELMELTFTCMSFHFKNLKHENVSIILENRPKDISLFILLGNHSYGMEKKHISKDYIKHLIKYVRWSRSKIQIPFHSWSAMNKNILIVFDIIY